MFRPQKHIAHAHVYTHTEYAGIHIYIWTHIYIYSDTLAGIQQPGPKAVRRPPCFVHLHTPLPIHSNTLSAPPHYNLYNIHTVVGWAGGAAPGTEIV